MNTILFPSSYFSLNEVDEELKKEYSAAIGTGVFDVILFSYDKWFSEGVLKLNRKPAEQTKALYRGWMMKPEHYKAFYNELAKQSIKLITTPEEYELFHIFPNIYEVIKPDTAEMLVYSEGEVIQLDEIKRHFPKFIVKDFVKSVKGTDFPKYFDSTIAKAEFDKQIEIFYKYRGGLYTGGICIKEFLPLKKYGNATNEYRVFYANNEVLSVSRNSGQPMYAPEPPKALIKKYSWLKSPYYTIDYAELENEEWKILETGDGQVSGLSDFQDYSTYFRLLYNSFLSSRLCYDELPECLSEPNKKYLCTDGVYRTDDEINEISVQMVAEARQEIKNINERKL